MSSLKNAIEKLEPYENDETWQYETDDPVLADPKKDEYDWRVDAEIIEQSPGEFNLYLFDGFKGVFKSPQEAVDYLVKLDKPIRKLWFTNYQDWVAAGK